MAYRMRYPIINPNIKYFIEQCGKQGPCISII